MSSKERFTSIKECRVRQIVTPLFLDTVVEEWIRRVKEIGSIVTNDDIRATAARAAKLTGFLGFEPNNQWLRKFKRKNHHSNKPIFNNLPIQKSLSLKRIIYELRPSVWQFNQDSSSDSDPEIKRPPELRQYGENRRPPVLRQYGKKRVVETEDNLEESNADKAEISNRCNGDNQEDISKHRSRPQVQQTNQSDLNTYYNIINKEAEALKTTDESRNINTESAEGEGNSKIKVECEMAEEGMTSSIFENDSYSIFRLNLKHEEEKEEMGTRTFGLLEPKHELAKDVTEDHQNINSSIKTEEDDIQNEEVKQSPIEKEINSYDDALKHLDLLEQFVLINRETEAAGLIKQLKNIIKGKT